MQCWRTSAVRSNQDVQSIHRGQVESAPSASRMLSLLEDRYGNLTLYSVLCSKERGNEKELEGAGGSETAIEMGEKREGKHRKGGNEADTKTVRSSVGKIDSGMEAY